MADQSAGLTHADMHSMVQWPAVTDPSPNHRGRFSAFMPDSASAAAEVSLLYAKNSRSSGRVNINRGVSMYDVGDVVR